ncbi:hypothetical protein [Gordonia neofelifaecis]|nr:hypothetical protein [Gordonia neofelifaecis]EGD53229.1 hypothetical protein SCNU_20117 [Gordonia neofelifaecis NRRL B-59395]
MADVAPHVISPPSGSFILILVPRTDDEMDQFVTDLEQLADAVTDLADRARQKIAEARQ